MEDVKSQQPDNLEKLESDGSGKRLSTSPVRELSYIVEFVNNVYTDLDHTNFHKAESIAAVNKMKVASIRQILSTAQQYNLLELKHGIGYKVAPTFFKIKKPLNDKEYRIGIMEALTSPQIFKELFTAYEGHVIKKDGLKNKIQRDYSFNDEAANRTADIFIENLNEYRLLNSHSILLSDKYISSADGPVEAKKEQEQENTGAKEDSKPKNKPDDFTTGNEHEVIKLPVPMGNGSFAYVIFPKDYDEDDLDMISTITLAYKKRKKKTAHTSGEASGN